MIGLRLKITGERRIVDWAERLPRDFSGRAARLVTAHALDVEREAKLRVPVRTNRLGSSIHTLIERGADRTTARIGTNVRYGPYVEYGTGLYGPRHRRIVPRTKRALSWRDRRTGRRITVRSVEGMRPRPYLEPALEEVRPRFAADLKKLANLMFPKV